MDKGPLIPLEELLAFLPDHVYWLDKDGVYQGCNEAQAKMMGFSSRNEVIGKRNKDLPCFKNHPELATMLDKTNSEVMQSGAAKQLEEVAYDANGTLSTYLSHKVPLKDSNDNVIGLLGSSYKIDNIKAKEDKLLAEKEAAELTLKSIIAHLPGHVYWKDKEGRYLGCNDKQARSLGFESEMRIIGKTDFELPWPAGSALKFRENDLEVMATGKSKIAEENSATDGREAVVLSQKVPLKDKAGQITGIIGISLDITELKKTQEREKKALEEAALANSNAQAQEEIQKAILTFTATMSHDLRTPLSTISLVDSLLLKTLPALTQVYNEFKSSHPDLDQDDPRYIHTKYLRLVLDSYKSIAEALKQAESYIEATLKIIRGAASGSELISKEDLVACSIEEILRRAIYTYPYKDEADQAKVHLDTMDAFEFMGNSIFMARIVQNLIKNAFEQIHLKGKGEIFVTCEASDPLNYLYIKDTAGGVSETILAQLFNGFNSTKRGGTGIGLSSAKQIMQAFGGDINCRLVDGDCIELVLCFPRLQQ